MKEAEAVQSELNATKKELSLKELFIRQLDSFTKKVEGLNEQDVHALYRMGF